MHHRIPLPSWDRESCQPCLGGVGHGASSADTRFPVVPVLLRGLGCRQFLCDPFGWHHQAKFSDI
jgi:hypothetical protein